MINRACISLGWMRGRMDKGAVSSGADMYPVSQQSGVRLRLKRMCRL